MNLMSVLFRDEKTLKAVFGLGREKFEEQEEVMQRLWQRRLGNRPGRQRAVEVIIDGMERPIQRAKKRATARLPGQEEKVHAQGDRHGSSSWRIGCLRPGKQSTGHDKQLLGQRQIVRSIPDGMGILAGCEASGMAACVCR